MSTPQAPAGVDPGPGWRLLAPNEIIGVGDENRVAPPCVGEWKPARGSIGDQAFEWPALIYRRRLPQPSPAPAPGLSAEPVAYYCEHKHRCKWQGGGYPAWGNPKNAVRQWLDRHQRVCGGEFILLHTAAELAAAAEAKARAGVYVASRASVPARVEMWQALRASGVHITSSWIDEAAPGASASLPDLWQRIEQEIRASERLVLYVEADDFPLKGALIETGIAIGAGVPVYVVAPGVELEPRSMRPLGSWALHPLVKFAASLNEALTPTKEAA